MKSRPPLRRESEILGRCLSVLLKSLKQILPQADPRESPALDIDAYDGDNAVWTTAKLHSAVYVTAAHGDLVFESDGSTIYKR